MAVFCVVSVFAVVCDIGKDENDDVKIDDMSKFFAAIVYDLGVRLCILN